VKKRLFALSSSPAFLFVLTMGIVNLFGDVTYEGGASINGPFLGSTPSTPRSTKPVRRSDRS